MGNQFLRHCIAAIAAATLCGAALADGGHGGHDHGHDHGHGDMHNYHGHYYYYPHWHEGYWHHGYRGSSYGWWWISGGAWYYYPQPIYPYPEPYMPPVVYTQRPDAESMGDMQEPPPADEQQPPPAQSWYYCGSVKKYYPYVASCPEQWQVVPATPPDR